MLYLDGKRHFNQTVEHWEIRSTAFQSLSVSSVWAENSECNLCLWQTFISHNLLLLNPTWGLCFDYVLFAPHFDVHSKTHISFLFYPLICCNRFTASQLSHREMKRKLVSHPHTVNSQFVVCMMLHYSMSYIFYILHYTCVMYKTAECDMGYFFSLKSCIYSNAINKNLFKTTHLYLLMFTQWAYSHIIPPVSSPKMSQSRQRTV